MRPLPRMLALLSAWFAAAVFSIAQPVAPHPDNPRLASLNGRPEILLTFGEHYSSVVYHDFDFRTYLDTLREERLNLTRAFLVGFRGNPLSATNDPLSMPADRFLQPWRRSAGGGTALDGLGKWDFDTWNEAYFERLEEFARAADERGIVIEFAIFCTFYTDLQWRSSPFHPSNNVQGLGPEDRYDCFRPANNGLLAVQETVVREIVRRLNRFDNILYNVQNEPFWNEPGVRDAEEVEFHNRMLAVIRGEEAQLPKRHLVGHNFPAWSHLLTDFDIINEHYPAAVTGTPIRGGEALLAEKYGSGKLLSLDETDPETPAQTRLEAWMFILGGGAMYNGLDYINHLYHSGDPTGSAPPGPAMREAVRNLGTYAGALHLAALRRDLAWVLDGIPAGARLQAMASPGQQYVAYLHHGSSGLRNFQLAYDPIDPAGQSAELRIDLPAGAWRVTWTRPLDLATIHGETIEHAGGAVALAPVGYHEDVALRIDRADAGDTTPPPHPRALRALPSHDGSIVLTWEEPDAPDVAEYRIHRRQGGDQAGPPLGTVPVGITTWMDDSAVPGMEYTYLATAVDGFGNESYPSDPAHAVSHIRGIPFAGSPHALPGFVEAEDFDIGGNGITYLDKSPGNEWLVYREDDDVDVRANESADDEEPAGHHVGSIEPGEWLQFSVIVAEHDVFRPSLRIRSPPTGGSWIIGIDGSTTEIELPAGDAGVEPEWQKIIGPEIPIRAGEHIIRLTFEGPDPEDRSGALDWIAFASVPKPPPVAIAGEAILAVDHDMDGWAEVALDAGASEPGEADIESYVWSIGSTEVAEGDSPVILLPHGDHVLRLTVTDSFGFSASVETEARVVAGSPMNGSFESAFDGWTLEGNVAVQQAPPYVASHGTRLISFNHGNRAPDGVATQTFTTMPGTTYELFFDYGVLAFNDQQQTLGVEVRGGSMLAETSLTTSRLRGSNVRWQSASLVFLADSAATSIVFRDLSQATHSIDLTLDNVRVVGRISHQLSIASSPVDGAGIDISPADAAGSGGGSAPLVRTYPDDTDVSISAAPVFQGLRFERWTRDGADLATTATIQVRMNAGVSLAAHYVEGPPTIVENPADVVAAEDEDVHFAVEAEGTGTLTYQWRRNGADIDGATGPALALADVTAADEGSYDVVVSNHVGSTTSAAATLTVRAAGEFANGSFEDGFDGWAAAGNVTIQQGGLYQATDGTQLAVFNNGNSVPNGSLERTFSTVPGADYILSFDFGVLAYNNNTQSIAVEIAGTGILFSGTFTTHRLPGSNIRWESRSIPFRADALLTTLRFRDVSIATNSLDLTLDNIRLVRQITRRLDIGSSPFDGAVVAVAPPDAGGLADGGTPFVRSYPNETAVSLTAAPALQGLRFEKWTRGGTTIATGATIQLTLGGDVSLVAHYVEGPPAIVREPADAVAAAGDDVEFSVEAEGTGTLVYQWRRNGENIDGATGPALTLSGVTAADEASYDVIVSNHAGSAASAVATLTVRVAEEFANGSFENGFDGWTVTGNVSIQQSGGLYQTTHGSRLAVFNNGNTVPNGALERTFATMPGGDYLLSFDFGVLAYNNNTQSLAVTVTGAATLVSNTFTIQRLAGSTIRWDGRSIPFRADSGAATLRFRDVSTSTNSLDLTLDNVRISPAAQAAAMAFATGFAETAAAMPPPLEIVPRLAFSGDSVEIAWDAAEPGDYQIQRSVNLRDWIVVRRVKLDAPGAIEFTDVPDAGGRAFYRLARSD